MVYTKHKVIHSKKHLNSSANYIRNAMKTIVHPAEHIETIFPYVLDRDKTMKQQLVSGYGIIDVFNATEEFLLTKRLGEIKKGTHLEYNVKNKKWKISKSDNQTEKEILARHLIQSFSPEDQLTPEQIHEIGRKVVLEFTGGEYEFVIATHCDKLHIHNHIIINTTNLHTGKALPWKISKNKNGKTTDLSKLTFETISDKVASAYGAKIIEKKPKFSRTQYTIWQIEKLYKRKIKSRVDFLLNYSSNLEDFKEKAIALGVEVDFSGKWTRYKLLDEPQERFTRSRSLSKTNSEIYNLEGIKERLKENSHVFTVHEIEQFYEEKIDSYDLQFDYQVKLESWQIHHTTEKGYYVNIDFGINNHGQIFVPASKVDENQDGSYFVYLKGTESFYFTNEESNKYNKSITAYTLMKQLSLYNGSVPITASSTMYTLHEMVEALRFLAEKGATNSHEMKRVYREFKEQLSETKQTLNDLDKKIIELNELEKLILKKESGSVLSLVEQERLDGYGRERNLTIHEIEQQRESISTSRTILQLRLDEVVADFNRFTKIDASIDRMIMDKQESEQVMKKRV